MKFGTNEIQKVYLGTTELDALYSGTNEVYSKGGGFDEYTLGVWHFEGNTDNAVTTSNVTLSTANSYYYNYDHKFGDYSARFSAYYSSSKMMFNNVGSAILNNDFTWDFWARCGSNVTDWNGALKWNAYGASAIALGATAAWCEGTQVVSGLTAETWHHIAIERYNNVLYQYVDGNVVNTTNISSITALYRQGANNSTISGTHFDEMRLSNVARYHGQNFTPPTQPY